VAIGEETGTLGQSLERLAKFYQTNAEQKVKTLTTLLEPMMILMMGVMVAGLALAVLLPMFNLVNVIK
jgi:type IV pilus assembly protein PilC